MDYDRLFESDVNRNLLYDNYPGNKLIPGRISLKNAIARLNKNEYYVLVTYNEGEELPKEYVHLNSLPSDNSILFATVNPNIRFTYICMDDKIQHISRVSDLSSGSPNYLLGSGPDTISLTELITEQYGACIEQIEQVNSLGM